MAELATVLADCELNVTASLVFGRGMATPPGNVTLLRATEPSLLFIPPSAAHPEGERWVWLAVVSVCCSLLLLLFFFRLFVLFYFILFYFILLLFYFILLLF